MTCPPALGTMNVGSFRDLLYTKSPKFEGPGSELQDVSSTFDTDENVDCRNEVRATAKLTPA